MKVILLIIFCVTASASSKQTLSRGQATHPKSQSYTVKKGDTLTGISKKLFGSLDHWPKLWKLNNPPLSNPHELEVGTRLTVSQPDEVPVRSLSSLPTVKLVPEGAKLTTDLEKDTIAAAPVRARHRMQRFILGNEDFLGEVTGSYSERRQFFLNDTVYIKSAEGKVLEDGMTYSLVAPETDLGSFNEQGYRLPGTLVRVVGEVKVISHGETHYKAAILALHSEAIRGAKVAAVSTLTLEPAPINPPANLISKILMGSETEIRALYQGGLALVDKGTQDGMKPGYLFRVFRDTDPVSKQRDGVEPDSKGELLIIQVGAVASVGYIRKSSDSIHLGDTLIAAQAFDSAPPVPRRESSEIEVD